MVIKKSKPYIAKYFYYLPRKDCRSFWQWVAFIHWKKDMHMKMSGIRLFGWEWLKVTYWNGDPLSMLRNEGKLADFIGRLFDEEEY